MEIIGKHEVREHTEGLGVNGMRILCIFLKDNDEGGVK
jgi:hypothetical protein